MINYIKWCHFYTSCKYISIFLLQDKIKIKKDYLFVLIDKINDE